MEFMLGSLSWRVHMPGLLLQQVDADRRRPNARLRASLWFSSLRAGRPIPSNMPVKSGREPTTVDQPADSVHGANSSAMGDLDKRTW